MRYVIDQSLNTEEASVYDAFTGDGETCARFDWHKSLEKSTNFPHSDLNVFFLWFLCRLHKISIFEKSTLFPSVV